MTRGSFFIGLLVGFIRLTRWPKAGRSRSRHLVHDIQTCLALAVDPQAIVLTADSAWAKLDATVDIQIIR